MKKTGSTSRKLSTSAIINRAVLWHFLGRISLEKSTRDFQQSLWAKSRKGKLDVVICCEQNEHAIIIRNGRLEGASPGWSAAISVAESVTAMRVFEDFSERTGNGYSSSPEGMSKWLAMVEAELS